MDAMFDLAELSGICNLLLRKFFLLCKHIVFSFLLINFLLLIKLLYVLKSIYQVFIVDQSTFC